MLKVTIETRHDITAEEMADELERVSNLLREGFIQGEVNGGWWTLEGRPAEEPETDENMATEN